ncbi:MAG: hypothetical protein WBA41_08575, partial [Rivularia sp. (in: cyanobacteria)]
TLASGSWDKTIKLWDTNTGQRISTLRGHSQRVWSVAFGSDSTILSSSFDKTIKIWKTL